MMGKGSGGIKKGKRRRKREREYGKNEGRMKGE